MLDTIEKSISNFSFVAPFSEEFIFVSSKNVWRKGYHWKEHLKGNRWCKFQLRI